MKVVIIGASFAGTAAAVAIRRKFKHAEIYVFDRQADMGYLPGGVNLFAARQVSDLKEARLVTEKELLEQDIQLMLGTEVTYVDTVQHVLTYRRQGEQGFFSFDKLILATGSSQWSNKILGSDSERVLKYKFLQGSQLALDLLESSRRVAVIGGGQIGAEAVDTLLEMKKEIHLFESMDYLLFKYFDREMVQPVQKEMVESGVVFHFDESVEAIHEHQQALEVVTKQGSYSFDTAIFAMNVRPDLSYLDQRVKRHTDGTVLVDEFMRTSQEDIFAVGDCIQIGHSLSEESFYIPLVNNAVRTALAASQNLIQPTSPFIGSVRTIGTRLVGNYVGSTGLTQEECLFYPAEVSSVQHTQKSGLFADEEVAGKLIYDKDTHKVLGAQLVSKTNILEKINTLALGIQLGMTLEDLYQKDYLYHPFFSSTLDITNALGIEGIWGEQDEG